MGSDKCTHSYVCNGCAAVARRCRYDRSSMFPGPGTRGVPHHDRTCRGDARCPLRPGHLLRSVCSGGTGSVSREMAREGLATWVEALEKLIPDQSHIIADVGEHFTNLWLAENLPLADFYLSETKSHLRWAVRRIAIRKDNQGREVNLEKRPNRYIKIPGTNEGLPTIEEAIVAGVPVNLTLPFSREHHVAAAEAYLRGNEWRIAAGLKPDVSSLASMFISRWDVTVTGKAPENLRNQLGIAIAQRTYKAYGTLIDSPRCQQILNAGARPQRVLWASTGIPDVVLPSRSRWPSDPLAVAGDWTGDQSRLTSAGPPGDRLPRKLPKSLRNARRGDRHAPGARTLVGIPRGDLEARIPVCTQIDSLFSRCSA